MVELDDATMIYILYRKIMPVVRGELALLAQLKTITVLNTVRYSKNKSILR